MLKRAKIDNLSAISHICRNSIVGTRILCYITAYGFERDFLEIWIIENEGELTGVLTKFFDDITLLVTDEADAEQISAFLGMFYYKTLMCSAQISMTLGFENVTIKNGYRFSGDKPDDESKLLEEEDFENAYALISREIPGSFSSEKEAYLSFLSDFTFRKRRGLARGVCTYTDTKLSSVALTSSETEDCAIISGVACDRSLRSRGLGKKTVLSLVKLLKDRNKTVFVIALNESAEGFYEHIGFIKTEKIAFVERENHV